MDCPQPARRIEGIFLQTYEKYKALILTLLGDEDCRRYRESYLNIGLKLALELYDQYFPRRFELPAAALKAGNGLWRINQTWQGEPMTLLEILSGGNGSPQRHPVSFAVESVSESFFLIRSRETLSDQVVLICRVPHWITGFGDCPPEQVTTIPAEHMLLVCQGAAGFAMQTRAAAVAEVFNRWPDNASVLMRQSKVWIAAFEQELRMSAVMRCACRFLSRGKGSRSDRNGLASRCKL